MGAVLAAAARMEGGLQRFQWLAPRALVAGMIVLASMGLWRGEFVYSDPVMSTIGFPLIALTFGALLVTVLTSPPKGRLERFFCNRSMRSWGKYSYGVYVFHYLIIGAFTWFFPLYQKELGGSRVPAVLLFAAIISVLSYSVAWLSYNIYEKRFLALKRFFERERVSPQPAEAPTNASTPSVLRPMEST
jgi:peptidoglycan/LPS O-acetylase OafA/YrhL